MPEESQFPARDGHIRDLVFQNIHVIPLESCSRTPYSKIPSRLISRSSSMIINHPMSCICSFRGICMRIAVFKKKNSRMPAQANLRFLTYFQPVAPRAPTAAAAGHGSMDHDMSLGPHGVSVGTLRISTGGYSKIARIGISNEKGIYLRSMILPSRATMVLTNYLQIHEVTSQTGSTTLNSAGHRMQSPHFCLNPPRT